MSSRTVTQEYKNHPSSNKIRYVKRIEDNKELFGFCEWDGCFQMIPVGGILAEDKEKGITFDITYDEAVSLFK